MTHNTLPLQKGTQNAYTLASGRGPRMDNMVIGDHATFAPMPHSQSVILWGGQTVNVQTRGASARHVVHIHGLNDKMLIVKRPIKVEITSVGDDIVASFNAAEMAASGEFAAEAIDWLKDIIASNFWLFRAERRTLGPLPRRQLAVLEKHVGKKQDRKKRRS